MLIGGVRAGFGEGVACGAVVVAWAGVGVGRGRGLAAVGEALGRIAGVGVAAGRGVAVGAAVGRGLGVGVAPLGWSWKSPIGGVMITGRWLLWAIAGIARSRKEVSAVVARRFNAVTGRALA